MNERSHKSWGSHVTKMQLENAVALRECWCNVMYHTCKLYVNYRKTCISIQIKVLLREILQYRPSTCNFKIYKYAKMNIEQHNGKYRSMDNRSVIGHFFQNKKTRLTTWILLTRIGSYWWMDVSSQECPKKLRTVFRVFKHKMEHFWSKHLLSHNLSLVFLCTSTSKYQYSDNWLLNVCL